MTCLCGNRFPFEFEQGDEVFVQENAARFCSGSGGLSLMVLDVNSPSMMLITEVPDKEHACDRAVQSVSCKMPCMTSDQQTSRHLETEPTVYVMQPAIKPLFYPPHQRRIMSMVQVMIYSSQDSSILAQMVRR